MAEKTTIHVGKDTANALYRFKGRTKSYDDAIQELLSFYQNQNRKTEAAEAAEAEF